MKSLRQPRNVCAGPPAVPELVPAFASRSKQDLAQEFAPKAVLCGPISTAGRASLPEFQDHEKYLPDPVSECLQQTRAIESTTHVGRAQERGGEGSERE
jgi:hypothetical protein